MTQLLLQSENTFTSSGLPAARTSGVRPQFPAGMLPLAPAAADGLGTYLNPDDFKSPASTPTFYRLDAGRVNQSGDIRSIFPDYKGDKNELVLFVLPHDDDGIIGAGYTLVNLIKAGVPVAIVVATDGSAGYCTEKERFSISKTRLREFMKSAGILGLNVEDGLTPPGRVLRKLAQKVLPVAALFLPKKSIQRLFDYAYENNSMVRFLNLPDGGTTAVSGMEFEKPLVRVLRQGFKVNGEYRQPTRIIYPTGNDAHLDHQNVAKTVLLTIFHGGGEIWKDTAGSRKLAKRPDLMECLVYCRFPGDVKPDVLVHGTADDQAKIIDGLNAYRSQLKNIAPMVERVQTCAFDFLRSVPLPLYGDQDKADYLKVFTTAPTTGASL